MSKEKLISTAVVAVGIMVLSVLAAQIGVDVYQKKHPTNFENLAWGSPVSKTMETREFGDYGAAVIYENVDGKLTGVHVNVPKPEARTCDYFFFSLVRRFDPPAATGGAALDFFDRATRTDPPKAGAYWASWFTTESAIRLDCKLGTDLTVSFKPLRGMDVRGQREF